MKSVDRQRTYIEVYLGGVKFLFMIAFLNENKDKEDPDLPSLGTSVHLKRWKILQEASPPAASMDQWGIQGKCFVPKCVWRVQH